MAPANTYLMNWVVVGLYTYDVGLNTYLMNGVVVGLLRTSVYSAEAMVFSGVRPLNFSKRRSWARLVMSPAMWQARQAMQWDSQQHVLAWPDTPVVLLQAAAAVASRLHISASRKHV